MLRFSGKKRRVKYKCILAVLARANDDIKFHS